MERGEAGRESGRQRGTEGRRDEWRQQEKEGRWNSITPAKVNKVGRDRQAGETVLGGVATVQAIRTSGTRRSACFQPDITF